MTTLQETTPSKWL